MRLRRRPKPKHPEWRPEWNALAKYNGERMRGVVHDPTWVEYMERVQAEYTAAHEQETLTLR